MSKRRKNEVGTYWHGYDLPHSQERGIRQFRKVSTGNPESKIILQSAMGDANESNGPNNADASEEANRYQAQMMPGLGRGIFGFPRTIITTMRYCEYLSLNTSSAALASNTFAANGIFDPDISGVGHQPMYRDNFAAVYDNYVVLGSIFKVTFITDTSTRPTLVGVCMDDDATFSTTATTRSEQNNSVQAWVAPTASGSQEKTFTLTYSPERDLGINAGSDGTFLATGVGSNPSNLWYFIAYAQQFASAASQAVLVKVEIDYTVKFAKLSSQIQN